MTFRQIIAAVVVAALLVAGGVGFVARPAYAAPADLMQPGPLGDEALGADNAPNVIIEYASMTCPSCALFANDVFPLLKQRYIDSGKVRFILREFPLDPVAAAAAALARCAGKDKFFETIELLFRTQRTWAVDHPLGPLLATANQAGFTEESFKACLANRKVLDGIVWVQGRAAKDFNVRAAPTFFVNGEIKVGGPTIGQIEAWLKAAPPPAPGK